MAQDSAYLDKIADLLTNIRKRAADGTTVADLTQDTVDAMRLAMTVLDTVSGMSGEEKKAEVLKMVGWVFDQYSDLCVPLIAKPVWWVLKPTARTLVLLIASGAIESLLPVVRSVK